MQGTSWQKLCSGTFHFLLPRTLTLGSASSQNIAIMLGETRATWRGHMEAPGGSQLTAGICCRPLERAVLEVQPSWAFRWREPQAPSDSKFMSPGTNCQWSPVHPRETMPLRFGWVIMQERYPERPMG